MSLTRPEIALIFYAVSARATSGVSARGVVYGPMAEVVHDSTQHLAETDLRAMALYLKSLKSFGAGLKAFDKALAKLQSGKKASVKAQLKKFVKEIEKSDAAAKKAAKLIGVTS